MNLCARKAVSVGEPSPDITRVDREERYRAWRGVPYTLSGELFGDGALSDTLLDTLILDHWPRRDTDVTVQERSPDGARLASRDASHEAFPAGFTRQAAGSADN